MHMQYRWLRPFVINWLLFASLAFLGIPAQAATFTVTNLNDSGAGSLRQALLDANVTAISDTITFQSGLTGTITLTSGEIPVTNKTIISGPGANVLAISGNNASRVFKIPAIAITISGLTIKNGKITNSSGGGMYLSSTNGSATLNDVILSNNVATSYSGGAIYNEGTALYINNTALIDNEASSGGAICTTSSNNVTIIRNSTISNNAATSNGGGIYIRGTATLINNTLFGNTANGGGGGIFNYATTTLINNTIVGNFAFYGSGVFNNGTTLKLANNIIAGNELTTNGTNIYSSFTSQGNNLFGENAASGLTNPASMASSDLVLAGAITTAVAPLANNGGPTQTQALVTGSPAINAGNSALVPADVTTDQRGTGFARIIETKVDIGAVEYGVGGTTYALTITKPGLGTGTVTSNPAAINCGSTCSFRFAANSSVTLTAVAATGSLFSSWSEACTGTAITCNVAMTAAKTATATFNLDATVPTVTTNAASNVTATSATLNAQVNSNGATATVSFDFGLTTAYGTSVTAASVYGNAAVTVNKPGLTCGQTYHYRVKAVNSKGTSYGTNSTFTTVACTVTRKWPDFVITSVTLTPATPVANGTFNLAVTVKNQGLRGGDGGFLDVWTNQAAVPTCGAEGTKYVDVGFLNAGASKIFTIAGIPAGTAGTKTARAFVDSWCEIVESNETNNQMIKAYSVQ